MKLYLVGHTLRYETGNLCFLFFPGEKLQVEADRSQHGDFYAITRVKKGQRFVHVLVILGKNGKCTKGHAVFLNQALASKRETEYALGKAFLNAGEALCGIRPPWGILTGIRPVKIAEHLLQTGMQAEQATKYMTEKLLVRPEKATLCLRTAEKEARIRALSQSNSVSLYIAIPFCPTRCLYCSFISHDVEKMQKLLPDYVEKLCAELHAIGNLVRTLGLKLETIYVGGGTPTSLSVPMLTRIFDTVRASFTLEDLREYTVEAGRPDTITPEKLQVIRASGCTRLCINPQTLNASVLKTIGRSHTPEQFFQAFSVARQEGFTSINCDLIVGLPGDTAKSFHQTMDQLMSLSPEGVTVHTLAMKRSSRLVSTGLAQYAAHSAEVNQMLEMAYSQLDRAGLSPYYLYRQRNTVGNLENTGFSKPGHEGLYNVFIMDETHTVLAAGAGGVTKMRRPQGTHIERVFNFKYPYEYIARFDQVIARKEKVEEFYHGSVFQDLSGGGQPSGD
ncbi:MAG TPA: coproporphyrinogen dehydrogenase HemZ [Ruminococcaceae bacterium]|nr:coproporphyrinogen dehydrogenase HemZ [Oscillospiraceae bacterium]